MGPLCFLRQAPGGAWENKKTGPTMGGDGSNRLEKLYRCWPRKETAERLQ